MQNAECRVSSQKQLITVFGVANAQKQGAMRGECIEPSSATMFQESRVQSAECRTQSAEVLDCRDGDSTSHPKIKPTILSVSPPLYKVFAALFSKSATLFKKGVPL